jgi:hypothetical protein
MTVIGGRMASTPAMGSPAPESSASTEPDTTVPFGPKESQPPPGDAYAVAGAGHGRPQRRLRRRRSLLPVILALIGGVFFIVAVAIYPRPNDFPIPSYPLISVNSTFAINYIEYRVIPVNRSVTEVSVRVILTPGLAHPPPKAPHPFVYLYLPPGITFSSCPAGICSYYQSGERYYWVESFNFTPSVKYSQGITGAASIRVFVRADDLGYAFNEDNADAAIPQITYTGPGSPLLETEYDRVPSPNRYDWSAFPPGFSNGTIIAWGAQVTNGAAPGRVSVGVDHASQTRDSNDTFIAGALIGLAGAALLSAIQEAFRSND